MSHATLCVPVPPTPYHTVPCSAIPCRTVPCRAVPCCVIPFRAVRCSGAGRGLGQVLLPPLLPPLKPRPVRAPAQQSRQRRRAQVRDSPTPSGPPGCLLCLWPSSATWSGLGKLRHSEVTALEKGCEPPPPPPPHCPPFTPSPRVWGSWGAGDPLFPGRRSLPPQDLPSAQTEKKGKLAEVRSETSWGGSEGPPRRTPTTFEPFKSVTLPPPRAVRTLYLWVPARHGGGK